MKHTDQLVSIQKASGLSQERLAARLDVSFATLNSWINGRSQPRTTARGRINQLYLETIGAEDVNEQTLHIAKKAASGLKATANTISTNKDHLDKLTLYLTYHTNTIEGSTMTLADVEDVLFDHKVLSNRTAIEQTEARNHQVALHWLLDELINKGKDFKIDESFILNLHLRLMNSIVGDAGQYRKHPVRIMGAHVPLANWQKVPNLVQDMTKELGKSHRDTIALIAATHARFEQIHPFSDGNGRTGRLIMLAQALHAGLIPPLVVKERRFAYYKYLEFAQTKDNLKPLELFVAESIQFTAKILNRVS